MGHIVVGVDETRGSAAALRWAADEAAARGDGVVAVLAWDYLNQHHPDGAERFDPSYGGADALDALDALVVQALGPVRATGVGRTVICDLPAHALLEAARGAELLVVGTRDLHGLRRALGGSVSAACVRRAPCPVVVVHDDGRVQRNAETSSGSAADSITA